MKSQLLPPYLLLALLCACGNNPAPNPDAGGAGGGAGGGNINAGICLDNDGDGVPGTGDCANEPKLDCDDNNPKISPDEAEVCNDIDDDCDGAKDEGLTVINYYRDQDGDGFGSTQTGEGCHPPPTGSVSNNSDCNDLNPNHKPGATETCDGEDENCSGAPDDGLVFKDFYPDQDGDGFGQAGGDSVSSCMPTVQGRVANNQDCNDTTSMVKPGAAELCNKADDNCDGQVDNGITFINYYPDVDGDGYGDKNTPAENSCSAIAGKVANNTDCNDSLASVKPGATEVCNSVDDDCDGQTDEGLTFSIYYPDSDGDGFGSATGTPQSSCRAVSGKVTNSQDCNDTNAAIKPTANELCNGVDDNCNGQNDDGLTFVNYYVDADGDGFGASNGMAQNSCTPLMGRVTNNTDCNDGNAAVKPGATEVCNGFDDNCVGGTDEGLPTQNYWVDGDNDGFGAAGSQAQASCAPVSGRVTNNTDCNDSLASVKPGATEVCNGVDDNCVGGIDDGLPRSNYYTDLDGDGYGSDQAVAQSSCAPVPNKVTNNTDCNDNSSSVRPNAPELCNLADDNCDGMIDNGVTTQAYYADADGDGFGAANSQPTNSCSAVTGRVTNSTDCNDADATIRPNATEVCNGKDDNCAGGVDDGLTFLSYYPDLDSDGYGAAGSVAQSSCAPVATKVTNNTDCADNNVNVNPSKTEVCNGVDDNCSGGVDDGLTFSNYYPDLDGDSYGASGSVAQSSCAPVPNKVTNSQDCNDSSSSIKPGAAEVCNNADDDCDGTNDEGNPGGGANCTTGQAGVCSPGTTTCQSGTLSCLRNVNPSSETCDGQDNDCDNGVDEDFPNKNTSCAVGLGVCRNTGTYVCNTAGTATVCSATAGAPTAPACDGNDNDCDGIADEPAFVSAVTMHNTAWTDIEVAPYYYSATSCQGGVTGSGTDSLVGGAAVMAGGTSGLYFQQLTATGAPVAGVAPKQIVSLTYTDVAIAQAGDGFIVAGLWSNGGVGVEIDFYYVDSTGTERAREWSEFQRTGSNTLDGLRLMRGNGKRVTVVWRDSGSGIKTARVEPFNTTGTWAILTPSQGAAPFTATTLVASANTRPGVGADSAHIDWNASVNCASTNAMRLQAVAYNLNWGPDGGAYNDVRYFTMAEDGTSKSADTTLESDNSLSYQLGEPEVSYYRYFNTNQWFIAFTESGLSPANEDLRWFMTHTWDGGAVPYEYAYDAYGTQNGSDSIIRPRASVTGTTAWLSAIRYVNDPSGFKRQVMTRKIILDGGVKDPTSTAVELSATEGACDGGDTNCRPGDKDGLTNFAAWSKVYYSNAGAPAGANSATLTCQ